MSDPRPFRKSEDFPKIVMAANTVEKLEVWKRACRQAVTVCKAIRECRDFAMKDQMTRAAISVPSNIAEGHERDSLLDFIRFLRIAKGSNSELRTQMYIAAELDYLTTAQRKAFVAESKEIAAMLHGLIQAQQKRLPDKKPRPSRASED